MIRAPDPIAPEQMPEGHKTHFLAREHHALLAGEPLSVSSPQGRFSTDAKKVSGKHLASVSATGKHLFYEFEGGSIIHVHLGRYGKFRQHKSPAPEPVGQVRMRMTASEVCIDLNGPTTCRVIDHEIKRSVIDRLGPDPLAGGRKTEVWNNINQSNQLTPRTKLMGLNSEVTSFIDTSPRHKQPQTVCSYAITSGSEEKALSPEQVANPKRQM